MSKKTNQLIEMSCVLAICFLVVWLFAVLSPAVFLSQAPKAVKILVELLPYLLMVGLVCLIPLLRKKPFSESLVIGKTNIGRQLLIGVILFIAISSVFVVIPLLLGADKSNVLSFKTNNPTVIIYYIAKDILVIGFGEELIWRGYFFEKIKEFSGSSIWAAVISSILFGLWHYPAGQNLMQVFGTMTIGLIFGFARVKIRNCSAISTGLAHGLHDAFIFILSCLLL